MKRSDPGGFWLLLLGLLVLLPSIWNETSITGGDEHRISFRTALETRDADQWLIPTYEGEPRLRKPPLFYWVLTATAEFLGPSLFNFRIWGVLCGALLAIFTARWGQRLFSADPVLTFVILISCLGLATESRRAMLDIPMALFLVLALERWGNCMKEARGRDAVFAGAFLAIAALIKPTAIYFFAAAIPVMAWLQPREKGLVLAAKRLSGLPLMLGAFCLLFLPWWLYVYSIYPDLLQSRIEEQVQNRELSILRWDSIPPLIGGWLGLAAPWSFALIFAVLRFLRRPEEGSAPPERWLAVWLVIASIPFLFMKTFERYLIPLLPAFAILISTYLDSLKPIPLRRHLLGAAFIVALPALFVMLFTYFFTAPTVSLLTLGILFILFRMALQTDTVNTALSIALTWSFCLGVLIPTVGIGEGPRLSPEILNGSLYQVGEQHVPLLDVQAQRPIPKIAGDSDSLRELPDNTCYLILAQADQEEVERSLKSISRESERVGNFGVFRSRKVFSRFYRRDYTEEHLKEALMRESLNPLRKPCVVIEVKAR